MFELYSHNNGRIGVMIEIDAETESASRTDLFRHLAHEIALQITSMSPLYIRDGEIPQQVLNELVYEASGKARLAGKPEKVIEQIVNGVLEKYRIQHVLLRQPYIRDEALTVAQVVNLAAAQLGEAIEIRRFERWEIFTDSEIGAA